MRRIKKQFWLSEKENAEFMKKVELCGLPQSTVIRMLIKGYEPREKPDKEFYDSMRQLYGISNNLNQVAVKANSLGFVDAPMLKEQINRLNQFQFEIEKKYLRPEKSNLLWK